MALEEEREWHRAGEMGPTGRGQTGLAPGPGALVPGVPAVPAVRGGQADLGLPSRAPLRLGTAGPGAQSKAPECPRWTLTWACPAAAGRTNSRSQSLRSTDARRRDELGDELQQFGFPSAHTGELQGWAGLRLRSEVGKAGFTELGLRINILSY